MRIEEPQVEKFEKLYSPKVDQVVIDTLVGESSKELMSKHLESVPLEEVSGEKEAPLKVKKKKGKAPTTSTHTQAPSTLTLHPLKLKDGTIEYKVKCTGIDRHKCLISAVTSSSR
ncbi:hypothetical protein U6M95_12435, partial [Cutibacterium acnes]